MTKSFARPAGIEGNAWCRVQVVHSFLSDRAGPRRKISQKNLHQERRGDVDSGHLPREADETSDAECTATLESGSLPDTRIPTANS